jgi:hypothetical protein
MDMTTACRVDAASRSSPASKGAQSGVNTRKVDDLVKALGAETGISKSEVSRICADLDAEVNQLPGPVAGRAGVPPLTDAKGRPTTEIVGDLVRRAAWRVGGAD